MSERTYDYSSTQIDITGSLKQAILHFHKKIKKENLYTGDGYGIEAEPHVTVLYGLHTTNADSVSKLIKDEEPVRIKLGKISRFESADKPYDVIKIDIDSPRLKRLHSLIADNEEHTSDFKEYHPHITLAYVKKGKHKELTGSKIFSGKIQIGDEVVFSSRGGNKKRIKLEYKNNGELRKKGFITRLDEMGVSYEKSVQAKSFLHCRISELPKAGTEV